MVEMPEMDFTLKLPALGKGRSLGELIIFVLAHEWPLSAKSLYQRASRSYFQPVSYQAVHKTITELAGQGVLAKDGMLYRLNVDWLEQLITFGFETKKAYLQGMGFRVFGRE